MIADLQSFFISSQPLIEKDIVNAINNGSNGTSLLTIDPTFTYVVEQMKEFTSNYFEYLIKDEILILIYNKKNLSTIYSSANIRISHKYNNNNNNTTF